MRLPARLKPNLVNAGKTTACREEEMQKKIYTVDGVGFSLKEDLTLEENEEVRRLIGGFYSGSGGRGAMEKFLAMVLESGDKKFIPGKFNFGRAKESVVTEIVKDFFLRRMKSASVTALYFENLTKEYAQPWSE